MLFITVCKVVGLYHIEEYYQEFKKLMVCIESDLLLISELNTDIVETLVYI